MRRPHAAAAAVVAVALILWLAVLTVAFHGCGSGSFISGCGRNLALVRRNSVVVSLPRKMLLAVASLDVVSSSSSPPTADRQDQHRHHHPHHHHHHHRHHHHQHQHQHQHNAKWNRQGIPPSVAPTGGETDPRYGVQKRLVPTGPNPLHH